MPPKKRNNKQWRKTSRKPKKRSHGGVITKSTTNARNASTKHSVKYIMPKKSIIKQPTYICAPSSGEDHIEAMLAMLIDFMGGSLYDLYVQTQLPTVHLKAVPHPMNPPMIAGEPTIYYGTRSGTHFTSTADGIHLFNSYTQHIQMDTTDHFCQTFALLFIIRSLYPQYPVAMYYDQLQPGEYMDNAYLAKNAACSILETLVKATGKRQVILDGETLTIKQILESTIYDEERGGEYRHMLNLPTRSSFQIQPFLQQCKNITKKQMCQSTFNQKVFRT